jgi:hypothetical protein
MAPECTSHWGELPKSGLPSYLPSLLGPTCPHTPSADSGAVGTYQNRFEARRVRASARLLHASRRHVMPRAKPQWMLPHPSPAESSKQQVSTLWSKFTANARRPVVELVDAEPPERGVDALTEPFQTQMAVVKPVDSSDPWSFLEPFDRACPAESTRTPAVPSAGNRRFPLV